jgi:predicted nicotinamide N-methyase
MTTDNSSLCSSNLFWNDENLFFPPQPEFRFGETQNTDQDDESDQDDDALGSSPSSMMTFFCELPPHYNNNDTTKRLTFGCREGSVGVLLRNEKDPKQQQEEQKEDVPIVDPFFFDSQYTLAGRTGFQVWAGSRILLEWLLSSSSSSSLENLSTASKTNHYHHHHRMTHDHAINVLELGAGVGLVGTCLAACGANVLLTDLPTLVENAVQPNLRRNQNESHESNEDAPAWLQQQQSTKNGGVVRIGNGWASATAVDWTMPVQDQLQHIHGNTIDMIVSSDCVWLQSMLHPLLDTVASLFEMNSDCVFILSFQRRDAKNNGGDNTMFTTRESIMEAIQARGWNIKCLAWRKTIVEGEPEEKDVFLFEILPSS